MTASVVGPESFLTLHYRLAGSDGADIINTFAGKPSTLGMGSGELSPALEQGLIVLSAGSDVLRFVPPLIITKEDIDEMAVRLTQALEA